MRIRLLVPIRYEGTLRDEGSEIELDKETSIRWIRDGQAIPVQPPKEKAVRKPKETRGMTLNEVREAEGLPPRETR